MDPSHDKNFAHYCHLCELVLSPTSYTSKFCSIYPNEVWENGSFFMVPHEEYETHVSPFDDDITRAHSYLHLQQKYFLIMMIYIFIVVLMRLL